METLLRGNTRLLIPLPPFPPLVKRIKEKAKELLSEEPLFYTGEFFEGFLIPWSVWYGLSSGHRCYQKASSFRLELGHQLENFFLDDYEKEVLFLDWIDEDNYTYINIADKKQYNEVFSCCYERCYKNKIVSITLYPKFLRYYSGGFAYDVDFDDYTRMSLFINNDSIPIFRKLKERGILI